jgi:hypothetical protein
MRLYKATIIKNKDNSDLDDYYIAKNIQRAVITIDSVINDCARCGFHKIPKTLIYIIDIDNESDYVMRTQIIPQIKMFIRDKKIDEFI